MKISQLDTVAKLLVDLGAVNWGLVGLMNYNLVESLLGSGSVLTQAVYVLIGVSGVYLLWGLYAKLSK